MAEHEVYEGWSILELMGHRRLSGYVREQEIAGTAFLRIDVPSEPPATQFYAPAAVYAITPTTEAIARALASRTRPEPVHRWELTAPTPPTVEATSTVQRADCDCQSEDARECLVLQYGDDGDPDDVCACACHGIGL